MIFGRYDLSDNSVLPSRFRPAAPIYRIVFARFEFAQASVHVSAQRKNLEIGTHGFQLRLAAQAAGANPRP